ncbi:MAG: glycosyltransferase [Muribaculaceae bacterium]|nr:glycosyltransferase [Muribaculaceae bacterium]
MKIVIINHSDSRGGASVVSYRLMEALRALGHDATMLVAHKATDNLAVHTAGPRWRLRAAFMAEHLRIFAGNGFNRADLFKASIATDGLPLSRHPLVRDADAVLLAWVNQGMLSLTEIARIASAKPTLWTMHDMWNLTGLCHHAGSCTRYTAVPGCGHCPLLHFAARGHDLSRRTWERKMRAYSRGRITFVAVSSWLKERCAKASLMRGQSVCVVPNAFPVEDFYIEPRRSRADLGLPEGKKIILMGAARLDDPIKGLGHAVDVLNRLRHRTDAVAVFFGALRDPHALDALQFPHILLGPVGDPSVLRELYAHATAVISTSLYETLPGTLIEGQAAGCTPVTFDSGGQRDIISSPSEGFIIEPYDTAAFAAALSLALDSPLPPEAIREAVVRKFAAGSVAKGYLSAIEAARIKKDNR